MMLETVEALLAMFSYLGFEILPLPGLTEIDIWRLTPVHTPFTSSVVSVARETPAVSFFVVLHEQHRRVNLKGRFTKSELQ